MTLQFRPLIKTREAIAYLNDIMLQTQTKKQMFKIIQIFHELLEKSGIKAAPDKSLFFLKKVRFLGHMILEEGLAPL